MKFKIKYSASISLLAICQYFCNDSEEITFDPSNTEHANLFNPSWNENERIRNDFLN
jgi:hypothetical protein